MKPVGDHALVADADVACYPQFTPQYIYGSFLFLRDVRTVTLSCCLLVDLAVQRALSPLHCRCWQIGVSVFGSLKPLESSLQDV